MNPLVSIVITTFNRKNLVGKTIESVLAQNYDNFEVIVVDDCSTDGTEQYICENWLGKLKYLKHKENRGLQHSCNTGFVNISKESKYFTRIDDDDILIDNSKIRKQVEFLESDHDQKYGIVTSSVKIIQENKEFIKIIKRPKNLLKHILTRNGVIFTGAFLLRTNVLRLAGMYSENLKKGIDSDVFRRIIILGYDVYFSKEIMLEYSEKGEDRMTVLTEKNIIKSIEANNYIFEKYSEYLDVFPSAKSFREFSQAVFYFKLYQIKKNKNLLQNAKSFWLKSFFTYPFNLKGLALYLLNILK